MTTTEVSGSQSHSASTAIRTRWAAIGAAVAVALGGVGGYGLVNADSTSGDQAVYTAISPCRITDTRADEGIGGRTTSLGADETMSIATKVEDGACVGMIPGDATAVTLNVTAVKATETTFLTIFPGGDAPNASTLNPTPGNAATVNGASTPLDTKGGSFSVRNNAGEVDVIIDVTGYYADHNHDAHNDKRNDERYEKIADQVIVAGFDFQKAPDEDSWDTDGHWYHDASAGRGCIYAPVDMPDGRKVTDLSARTVSYQTATVEILLMGRRQSVGSVEGPLNTDPVVDDEVTIPVGADDEIIATSFNIDDDAIVTDDYSYSLFVCSSDDVWLAAVAIDLAP